MNSDGTIKSTVQIDENTTNGPSLSVDDKYGHVASIGDLNNDGIMDIAVGANGDDTGGNLRGSVYIHFLNTDGSVQMRSSSAQHGWNASTG